MRIEPGASTASPFNVRYRIDRIASYLVGGNWLDYGCADGGYTASLKAAGAANAVGVDIGTDRVDAARRAHPDMEFEVTDGRELPFPDASFDGVFMNEVFEHVEDEGTTLRDVHRVLRPGGVLIVISPNRGFPFEGHRIHIKDWTSSKPTPFIPWLPRSVSDKWVTARNYWPSELSGIIEAGGFSLVETGFIMPVFENYSWMPEVASRGFRKHVTSIDHWPGVRRLGVSNLVVGCRLG